MWQATFIFFFIDFLHLYPGGGPAQVFAHPHARQARPAPPLHRDLGLCHGLLNHANFSKLTPCQKKQTSQELSTPTVGLVYRGPGLWPELDVHLKKILCFLGCAISCKHSTAKFFFFRNKDDKYLFHFFSFEYINE